MWTVQFYITTMNCNHCVLYVCGLFAAFAYGKFVCVKNYFNMFFGVNLSIFYNIYHPRMFFFIDYRWMLLCLLYILDHVCFPILILQVRNIIFKINCGTCIIFPTETFYNLNVKWSHKIKDRQRLVSIANTVNTNTLKT